MESYRKLGENSEEALEFIVKEGSKVVGIPLMNMKRKDGTLVCSIMRNDKIIIPSGQDSIQVGDRVVIVHDGNDIKDIDDILK